MGVRGDVAGTEQVLPALNQLPHGHYAFYVYIRFSIWPEAIKRKRKKRKYRQNSVSLELVWMIVAVPIIYNFALFFNC